MHDELYSLVLSKQTVMRIRVSLMVASCVDLPVTALKYLSYLSATMLKSPFKFLGFSGHAKTPKPNPHNERKTKGPAKLRKVRRPADTSVNTADRPSIPMKELKVNRSTVVTEGKHSREHYQNQVRTFSVFSLQSDMDNIV